MQIFPRTGEMEGNTPQTKIILSTHEQRYAHPDLSEGPWQTRRTAISRTSTKNKSCRWVDQQVPSSSVGECVHGDTHDGQQNRGSSEQEIQNDTVTQTSHSSDIWAKKYALCNSLIDLLCPLQQNSH